MIVSNQYAKIIMSGFSFYYKYISTVFCIHRRIDWGLSAEDVLDKVHWKGGLRANHARLTHDRVSQRPIGI